MKPGIYHGVPMEEYLQWPAYSSHLLKEAHLRDGSFSPAHLRQAMLSASTPSTRSQTLGTLVHALVLEPEEALRRYVAAPCFEQDLLAANPDWNPKGIKNRTAYKEAVQAFAEANSEKEPIDCAMLETAQVMARKVRENAKAAKLLAEAGESEVSLIWRDPNTGLMCKRRPDKRGVELKTSAFIDRFRDDLIRYGYDLQCAMEQDAWAALDNPWYAQDIHIVAVESVPPFTVLCAPVSEQTIEHGRDRYSRSLRAIRDGLDRGEWPSPPDPETWDLPEWADPPVPTFGKPTT